MTSGNRSEEPIVTDNGTALEKLGGIADSFLVHDRPIWNRCDDSVARVIAGRPTVLRRSRGFVPRAVALRRPVRRPVWKLWRRGLGPAHEGRVGNDRAAAHRVWQATLGPAADLLDGKLREVPAACPTLTLPANDEEPYATIVAEAEAPGLLSGYNFIKAEDGESVYFQSAAVLAHDIVQFYRLQIDLSQHFHGVSRARWGGDGAA